MFTADDLQAWQTRMRYSQRAASAVLKLPYSTYRSYLPSASSGNRRRIPGWLEQSCHNIERLNAIEADAATDQAINIILEPQTEMAGL